jgi:membrane-associated protease RseP (regulator of RpoE activity)
MRRLGKVEEEYKSVSFKFGILMLRTKKGLNLLDKLARVKITKPLAWIMLYLMPIAAAAALFLILGTISIYLSPQGADVAQYVRSLTPLANLLFPGINPYLPIVYGWIALIVAIVAHEAAHGIVAKSLNLPVKSAGLLFFLVIPIGAFVEVDDKQLRAARARDAGRVLAAGSGINFIIGLISLALLIISVASMVPIVKGAAITAVAEGSYPAYTAGIKPGDFITAINNTPITDLSVIRDDSTFKPGQSVNLTIWRNGEVIQLRNVTLGKAIVLDTRTNETSTYAFLGVQQASYDELQQRVSVYSNSFLRFPFAYVCIPTLPRCQQFVPFADTWIGFYESPQLGPALPIIANTFFWMWFINFNLAIFNSLPIYPMDGGQAFETAIRSVGRGRISDEIARRITTGVTLLVATMILFVVAGPYINGFIV